MWAVLSWRLVSQAAAMMDADVHIWMMHHQQGRLLCQGMRSKRSLQGPASHDADGSHLVSECPCAAAREDLSSCQGDDLACPEHMMNVAQSDHKHATQEETCMSCYTCILRRARFVCRPPRSSWEAFWRQSGKSWAAMWRPCCWQSRPPMTSKQRWPSALGEGRS